MSNAKKSKAIDFFKNKNQAVKLYGEAKVRPQNSIDFLYTRRKINYGVGECVVPHPKFSDVWNWVIPKDCDTNFTEDEGNFEGLSPDSIERVRQAVEITYPKKMPPIFVDTAEQLGHLLLLLQKQKVIAVDMECSVDHSYTRMTCLIQIGIQNGDFIIDAIKLHNQIPTILKQVFEDPSKVLVFHGGQNDIVDLKKDFEIFPVGIFDIQAFHLIKTNRDQPANFELIMSTYLGPNYDPFPLAVNKNVMQLCDWRNRPLKRDQLRYAQNDVHYLLKAYCVLQQVYSREELQVGVDKLKQVVAADLFIADSKTTFEKELAVMLKQLKIQSGLNASDAKAAKLLWEFRKVIAMQEDSTQNEVMSMRQLYEIVTKKATTIDEIQNIIRGNSAHLVEKHSRQLVKLLTGGEMEWEKMQKLLCFACGQIGHIRVFCTRKKIGADFSRYLAQNPNKRIKKNAKEREKYFQRHGVELKIMETDWK